MNDTVQKTSSLATQDGVLENLLSAVPFDGWQWDAVTEAAIGAGYDKDTAITLFPGKLPDVVNHFSDWADRQMLLALKNVDIETLRIRDRITDAVMERFIVLSPHKQAVKMAMTYWAMPARSIRAGKAIWRTTDCIWDWAGDTSTDYNHYTKRGLLTAVITSATLCWAGDDSDDLSQTKDFLKRRIENVMKIGQLLGKRRKVS